MCQARISMWAMWLQQVFGVLLRAAVPDDGSLANFVEGMPEPRLEAGTKRERSDAVFERSVSYGIRPGAGSD